MKKSARLAIFFVLVGVVIVGIALSPRFLLYSSDMDKTGAIILLLGEDFNARKKEVDILTNKGSASYLIIPAYYKIYRISDKSISKEYVSRSGFSKRVEQSKWQYRIYENTHLEIIESKIIMSKYNLKSAVFVSSPYHMRRIKIIVSKVFNEKEGTFYFTATRYEKAPANFWELSLRNWKHVFTEYLKIIWFFVYVDFLN
ncbi:MAG TPA: ElyC/SanA/YdcF family protein [Smithellaceae bacterium]|nr:ElyC/SanA/YdcF family protein [Smithellaceae bacterium]HQB92984.1 ElyC/SanA/YdcF family protein [Smithellaceae bacterium]